MTYNEILINLISRYPALDVCKEDILNAYLLLKETFKNGNKLLLAGNGGSAADCEHIAGELLKSFRKKRNPKLEISDNLEKFFGKDGVILAGKLETGFPAIPLCSFISFLTAYINDSDPDAVFAQLVNNLGCKNDVLFVISTSGNSINIINSVMTAKALGLKTISLTGISGGSLNNLCNVIIKVPSNETYIIQEYHLPIYHSICEMLENDLFE